MKFIEGHEVQCDYCKNSFVFKDARDLDIDIKNGRYHSYLKCPKCGEKIWSDGIIVIRFGSKPKREPQSAFEADLLADINSENFDEENIETLTNGEIPTKAYTMLDVNQGSKVVKTPSQETMAKTAKMLLDD